MTAYYDPDSSSKEKKNDTMKGKYLVENEICIEFSISSKVWRGPVRWVAQGVKEHDAKPVHLGFDHGTTWLEDEKWLLKVVFWCPH